MNFYRVYDTTNHQFVSAMPWTLDEIKNQVNSGIFNDSELKTCVAENEDDATDSYQLADLLD